MSAPTTAPHRVAPRHHAGTLGESAHALNVAGWTVSVARTQLRQYLVCLLVGVCLWDGVGYAARGDAVARGGTFEVLRRVPGGMHTHGVILLGLALLLTYGLGKRNLNDQALRVGLIAGVIYSAWVTYATLFSWWLVGIEAWGAPSKWVLAGGLFTLLTFTRPRAGRQDGRG